MLGAGPGVARKLGGDTAALAAEGANVRLGLIGGPMSILLDLFQQARSFTTLATTQAV